MDRLVIRPAQLSDATAIAGNLSAIQRKTIRATDPRDLRAIVEDNFRESTAAWCAVLDGQIVALWGVFPLSVLTGIGYPWLFASESFGRHRRAALLVGRAAAREMLRVFPRLVGTVDNDFHGAVIYAKHLGFAVSQSPTPTYSSIEMVRQ